MLSQIRLTILERCAAPITAIWISSAISSHFVWISKQNYNFSYLIYYTFCVYIFHIFYIYIRNWSRKKLSFPLHILFTFLNNDILKTCYPHLQNLCSYMNHNSSEKGWTNSFLGVWNSPTYWSFYNLHGCAHFLVVQLDNTIRFSDVPGPFNEFVVSMAEFQIGPLVWLYLSIHGRDRGM